MEFEENELIGKSIGIVCSKELIKPMDNLLRKDFIRNTKAVFFTKSHREIPVCLSTSIIQDNEKITGIVCMLQVTNKHNLMEEINSKIFEHCAEAIIITDSQSNILDANPAYTKLTGYNKEEVIGQNPRVLKSNHHNVKFYQNM